MLVKFCGMTRQQDLTVADALGVDFCGFIFHPGSPRFISPSSAGRLDSGNMKRVGVFADDDRAGIESAIRLARLDMIQLHGAQDAGLGRELGPERVIRVVWPERYSTPEEMQNDIDGLAESCVFFLLDAGMSGGGSGKKLERHLLNRIAWPRPWFLAGGLSPGNVAVALGECSPAGLDFNSGLEDSPGRKNSLSMALAVKIVKRARGV